jgi:hypothetical protein
VQRAKQTGVMAFRPRLQLIDPDDDPLKTTAGVALAEDIMSGTVGDDETLTLSATGLTVGKSYVVRLMGWDAAGSVDFYGRDVVETLNGLKRDPKIQTASTLLLSGQHNAAGVILAGID